MRRILEEAEFGLRASSADNAQVPVCDERLDAAIAQRHACHVELTIGRHQLPAAKMVWYWYDDGDAMLRLNSAWRAKIHANLAEEYGWDACGTLFRALIKTTRPIWGELNRTRWTGRCTVADPESHETMVPHLGTCNYFGEDYCRFFGGLERFQAAGFGHVEEFKKGVLVELPDHQTEEEYRQIRSAIEHKLAAGRSIFGHPAGGIVPEFSEGYSEAWSEYRMQISMTRHIRPESRGSEDAERQTGESRNGDEV